MGKGNGGSGQTHRIVTSMKGSTKSIRSQVWVFLRGRVEISTAGVIKMMRDMGMGRCIGLMGVVTKATGRMESSTDLGQ